MNQVFQAMGDHVQCGCIDRTVVAALGLEALGPENVVDFFLDVRQFGLCIHTPDPPRQRIKSIERTFPGLGLPDPEKLPGRREKGGDTAEHHRAQIDVIAILIHETLRRGVVDGQRAGMDRKVGIGVGAWRGDLSEKRMLAEKFPADLQDGLGEVGSLIPAELLARDQVQRSPQGRQIVVQDRDRVLSGMIPVDA